HLSSFSPPLLLLGCGRARAEELLAPDSRGLVRAMGNFERASWTFGKPGRKKWSWEPIGVLEALHRLEGGLNARLTPPGEDGGYHVERPDPIRVGTVTLPVRSD
ncbi:MAG: hypothetical protein HY319_12275, partial [Armatimonadetes bacterium]|nr:hypothetical protein [Armatimonadota bacterium]